MFSGTASKIRACVCYVWDCGNKLTFRSRVHFIAVQLYHQRRHFTCSHTDWSIVVLSLEVFLHQRLSSRRDLKNTGVRFLEISDLYRSADGLLRLLI